MAHFAIECENDEILKIQYMNFLIANYAEVTKSPDWKRIVVDEEECSHPLHLYRNGLLYEISRRLTAALLKVSEK